MQAEKGMVIKMPNVILISHTPNPQENIAASAKLCYSPATIDTLMDGMTSEKAEGFLDMLVEIGHGSPVEHANFTFGIEGVSRSFLAQITRHRIGSYSVQSQRYVKESRFEYVLPPEIAAIPEALDIYNKSMERIHEEYKTLTDILKAKHLATFVSEGMEEKAAGRAAEKKAIEDARFVLPNACTTKMIVTMNARSLMNFFHHRCCSRAQWEIKEVSDMMLAEVLKVAPTLFKNAGPSCVSGPCPEGRMTCGKINQVRAHYKSLVG